MNKMIAQMWPFIGDYVRDLLMTQIQKTVQESASVMGSFKFVKIDLGDIVSTQGCLIAIFSVYICLVRPFSPRKSA